MIKIPTKSRNCGENTWYSFRIFFIFALERNNCQITASCDEIFDLMFVANIAKIFANRSRIEYDVFLLVTQAYSDKVKKIRVLPIGVEPMTFRLDLELFIVY